MTDPAPPPASATEPVIEFSAEEVVYENTSDLVTAQGQVRMSREGNYLAADKVSWDRRSGRVLAEGNVVIMNPQGDKLVGDKVDLTDSLRDGTVENLLIVLESGGRIAANRGRGQATSPSLRMRSILPARYQRRPDAQRTRAGRSPQPG